VHQACPLAAFLSEVSQDIPTSYIQRLQQLGILKKKSSKQCIPIQDVNIVRVEGKGNCLFASIWLAHQLSKGLPVQSADRTRYGADKLREGYLAQLTKHVAAGRQMDGVPLRTFVEASADRSFEEYISVMQHYGDSPSQWGGFAEGCILASWCHARVFFFERVAKGIHISLIRSGGQELSPDKMWYLLWGDGGHYDVISACPAVAARLTSLE
jgi:hypothetical protein